MSVSVNTVVKRENHAELINGKIVVTGKTSIAHNNAVLEIATALRRFIAVNHDISKVFTENVALYCNELCGDEDLFLPDIMTVCNVDGIKDDGVHTAPLFVAEVTSEFTKKNDYGRKMLIYRDIGVKEYWVVDIQRKVLVRYLSENDFAPELVPYPFTGKVCVHTYPSLEIDLSPIFMSVLEELDKGIDDLESGRVTPHEETMKILYQQYNDGISQKAVHERMDMAIKMDNTEIKEIIEWCDENGHSEDEILELIRRIVGAKPPEEEE